VHLLADDIGSGRESPFYMKVGKRLEQWRQTVHLLFGRFKTWTGHLAGERYNTPSLRKLFVLNRELRKNLQAWRSMQSIPPAGTRALLYPLQMQPEGNLDVWGQPHSDQIAVLTEMLNHAPSDVHIAVKINPKSKYETSAALIDLAAAQPRVHLLPPDMPMREAQGCTLGTLSVSGTVAYEAVFGRGRCVSLRHPILEDSFPSMVASSVAEGVSRLLNEPQTGVGDRSRGAALIKRLVKDSFPGEINEPAYSRRCVEPANIERVTTALKALLTSTCASPKLHESCAAHMGACQTSPKARAIMVEKTV
jgi:hypothetical protein